MSTQPNPEIYPNPLINHEGELDAAVFNFQEFKTDGELVAMREVTECPSANSLIAEQSRVASGVISYRFDLRKVEPARNDPFAFENLVEEYKGLIRKVANDYFLTGGDGDDLFQEAMIGFFKGARDYDGKSSSFHTFAELCMRRQVITAIKTATRQKHRPLNESVSLSKPINDGGKSNDLTLGDLVSDKSPLPEDVIVSKESFSGIIEIITCDLSYLESRALKMYLEGRQYIEIAEELDESPKTIDNALQRVKRKIADYLELQK